MKKKLVAILSAIVMLTAVFLFAGCDKLNNSNTGNNENSENQGGGKPTIPTRMWLKNFEKKEFSVEKDVSIELCIGTYLFKEDDRYTDGHVDIIAKSYKGKQPFNLEREKFDAEDLLLQIEDFYAENYPLSMTEDLFFVAPSFIVTLPKTLFVGEDGLILIEMYHLGMWGSVDIYYSVDSENVILGKYEDIYSSSDSQSGIS